MVLLLLSQAYNSFTLLLASAFIALGFGTMQSCFQVIAIKGSTAAPDWTRDFHFPYLYGLRSWNGAVFIRFHHSHWSASVACISCQPLSFSYVSFYIFLSMEKKRPSKNCIHMRVSNITVIRISYWLSFKWNYGTREQVFPCPWE